MKLYGFSRRAIRSFIGRCVSLSFLSIIGFSILLSGHSEAQINPDNLQCGTILPGGDSLDSLYARHQRFLDERDEGGPVGLLGLRIIPVQFHIIRDDGGSGGPAGGEAGLLSELAMYVNPRYAGAGLFFTACSPANIVNSSQFQTLSDYDEGDLMASMYNIPNVLNIYVVDDPAGLCGWANFTTSLPDDYVVLAYNCATNTSTMAHEIGHYFDLFHTHETTWGAELVNGSNCTTAGDLICDTPADPVLFDDGTMMYKVDPAPGCAYNGTEVDANNDMYMPDPTNLMSYSRKDCRDNFTPLQLAKANYTANNGRSYVNLISCPPGTIEYVDANCQLAVPDYRDLITFNAPCVVVDTTQSPAPGSIISNLGFTLISITVTDMNGDFSTCDFYITVVDTINPTFTAVSPDTIQTDLLCQTMLPDYRDSTMVMDNCDPNPIITQEPAPGTDIGGVGTNITVYVIAEDASGNRDTLPVMVTVEDSDADAELNCRDINLSLDVNNLASFQLAEIVQGANCSELHTVKIETESGALVFQAGGLIRSSYISFAACNYRYQRLKVTVTNESGQSCWCYITLKQSQGPLLSGRSYEFWCFDTLLTDIDKYFATFGMPVASIPCFGTVPTTFVADWIIPYDCVPGMQDTAKVILREYEAFDKEGRRGTAYDTIVVYRIPQLTNGSLFCAETSTIYCSDTSAAFGPVVLVGNPYLGGASFELVDLKLVDGELVFDAIKLDPKCGLQVHVDYWKYGENSCDQQYKVIVELKQECPGGPSTLFLDPPATNMVGGPPIPPNVWVPQTADYTYWKCEFWVNDLDTLAPVVDCKDQDLLLTTVYTTGHECAAHTYVPPVYVSDDWTGVKQVKASIEGVGSTIMFYNTEKKCYESHTQFKLPHRELPYMVIYEALDSCHNIGYDSCFIRVKDLTKPVAVADKGVTVSLSDKKVWVDAGTFDEGSWDNCGVNILLARRSDWYEACVNLCDSVDTCFVSEHHDLLMQSFLEVDKHLEPVEAHYAKTLDWLCQDQQPCGELIYNAWQYDLMKYATLNCLDHPYAVGDDYFESLFREALNDYDFSLKWKNPTTLFIGTSRFGSSNNETYYLEMNGTATPVFDELGAWGATTDFANKRILFTSSYEGFDNEGNVLYALPFGGTTPVKLGRIVNADGNDSIRIDGLALSGGVLYGSQQFDRAHSRGIYKIDLSTLKAELVLVIPGDPAPATPFGSGVGGIDADPRTQKIYGADDYHRQIIEIDIEGAVIKKIADYPDGVTDIDGVAVGSGRIFLVTGTTGSVYVYSLESNSYINPVGSPIMFSENFAAGAAYMPMLEDLVDTWSQIGGGWSDAVPFSCEDACGPVTVEILVMDYWCNWSTAWTKVWVEDKTPVKVAKDVVDGTITCKVYKDNNYAYPGEQHPVSIEYIVDQAKSGEADAYAALDGIFGGYCKAWVDPYGNFVDIDGYEIDCDIPFYDSVCYCTSYYEQVRVYDDHLGYIWVDSLVTHCYYEADTLNFQKGIVAVNCAENVYCEQEVWCDFDHCGQGYIYRKFKIWSACAEASADSAAHIPDTIYRHQKIYVGNECELNKYMFEVPGDVEVFSCSLEYGPDGNVTGVAGPENTGYAEYLFDDDCRIVGIAHEDKVFKIVGGDAACYKILRTWYFADWCNYGGDVATGSWWLDPGIVVDKCVQKIIVTDTVAPVCVITGPVESGDTVTLGACEYTLEVDVDAMDECGLTGYYWELKDITDAADHLLIDSGSDALDGGAEESFSLSIEGLLPGTYKLKVEIQDECTNESYCEYMITVASGKKPTPVCITSLTARLTPWDSDGDGEVDSAHAVVWAYEFDRSSTPACGDDSLAYRIEFLDGTEDDETAAGDLDYLEVGCADVGSQIVRMWVISLPSDTRDYCDAVLVVQSDGSGCPTTQGQGGDVMTYEGDMTHTTPGKEHRTNEGNSIDSETEGRGNGDWAGVSVWDISDFHLYQNRPNPVRSRTIIGFRLPKASEVTLSFYDLNGRLIKTHQGFYRSGYHEEEFNISDFSSGSNVFYYQLESPEFSSTRKMVVFR